MFGSSTPNNAIPNASTGSGGGGGGMLNAGGGSGKFNSENGSECSSVTSESIPAGYVLYNTRLIYSTHTIFINLCTFHL